MTEYQEGYNAGYEACKKDFASDPAKIFELANDVGNHLNALKPQVPKEFQEMIDKVLRGDTNKADFMNFVNEQKAK